MCCCGQSTLNGQPGYRWQPNDPPRVRPVDPPPLAEGDEMLADEPGRCGGLDSHSHHYRLVKARFGRGLVLLVQHGGGNERIDLGVTPITNTLLALDSNARYWLLNSIYHIQSDAATRASQKMQGHWRAAAAEKRIKTRKRRNSNSVKVWIEASTG